MIFQIKILSTIKRRWEWRSLQNWQSCCGDLPRDDSTLFDASQFYGLAILSSTLKHPCFVYSFATLSIFSTSSYILTYNLMVCFWKLDSGSLLKLSSCDFCNCSIVGSAPTYVISYGNYRFDGCYFPSILIIKWLACIHYELKCDLRHNLDKLFLYTVYDLIYFSLLFEYSSSHKPSIIVFYFLASNVWHPKFICSVCLF